MLKLSKRRSAKKGFSLIELLLVIGFVSVAAIAVYVTYNKVTAANAANTESKNIDTLRAGVKNLYAGQFGYAGLDNGVAIKGRAVPDNMVGANGTTIYNSFGGAVTVAASTLGTSGVSANNAFTITYNNVPVEICPKLATISGSVFNKVVIGSTTVKDTSSNTKSSQTLNVSGVTTSCDSGGGYVTMQFTSL